MKMPKKFDIIIFAAFFITVACLCVTVGVQLSMNKQLSLLTTQESVTQISIPIVTYAESTTLESETISESETVTVVNVSNAVLNAESTNSTSAKTTAPNKTTVKETTEKSTQIDSVLIVNKNSKKIHSSTCSYAQNMNDENKLIISSDELQSYLDNGYTMCSRCHGYGR